MGICTYDVRTWKGGIQNKMVGMEFHVRERGGKRIQSFMTLWRSYVNCIPAACGPCALRPRRAWRPRRRGRRSSRGSPRRSGPRRTWKTRQEVDPASIRTRGLESAFLPHRINCDPCHHLGPQRIVCLIVILALDNVQGREGINIQQGLIENHTTWHGASSPTVFLAS